MLIYDLLTMANEVLYAYMFHVLFFSGKRPVCLCTLFFLKWTWYLNNVMDLIAARTLFFSSMLDAWLYSNVESYPLKSTYSRLHLFWLLWNIAYFSCFWEFYRVNTTKLLRIKQVAFRVVLKTPRNHIRMSMHLEPILKSLLIYFNNVKVGLFDMCTFCFVSTNSLLFWL